MDQYKMIIGGDQTAAASSNWASVINPATGEPFAEVPQADHADVEGAIAAASAAFPTWAKLSPGERADWLYKLADALEAKTDLLVELESRNTGKPLKLSANSDIPFALDNLRYFAGQARSLEGCASAEYVTGYSSVIRREPIGVVAAITPWNYPFMMAIWKLGPALAAGNTAVIKPAPQTPLTTLVLAQTALEIGFPPGVINVVTGGGPSVGEPLVTNPNVRMVCFTGSTSTGRRIMELAAQKLTRVHLELGGKAPFIVFADADIEAAAHGAVLGAYMNSGQDCTAATRMLVARERYEEFLDRYVALSKQIRVGDPFSDDTDMGPLVSADHLQRVQGFVQRAKEAGISVALDGGTVDGTGYFFKPTIFAGAAPDSEIMQEEVFGPVPVVTPFDTEAEALEIGNGVKYGLAASVWTKDMATAWRTTAALEFGTVWVNDHLPIASEMPHGGFKQSGFGKDMSKYALEDYTIPKHIMFELEGVAKKEWHQVLFDAK
jgi:betaine-aldehyde dehydrogenase